MFSPFLAKGPVKRYFIINQHLLDGNVGRLAKRPNICWARGYTSSNINQNDTRHIVGKPANLSDKLSQQNLRQNVWPKKKFAQHSSNNIGR